MFAFNTWRLAIEVELPIHKDLSMSFTTDTREFWTYGLNRPLYFCFNDDPHVFWKI